MRQGGAARRRAGAQSRGLLTGGGACGWLFLRSIGLPVINWCGEYSKYNCLVMDLLGDSLETLFNKCNRKFSLKTVLMIAFQMVRANRAQHRSLRLQL